MSEWPTCATYPNLECVCRGALQSNKATCTRKRTGDLAPLTRDILPGPTDEQVAEVRARMDVDPEIQQAVEQLRNPDPTRGTPPAEGDA